MLQSSTARPRGGTRGVREEQQLGDGREGVGAKRREEGVGEQVGGTGVRA